MALKDNKKNVLNQISAYSSLKEERKSPNSNNSFNSVNNKQDPIPYMLDVLKGVVGTDALKQLVGGMFTNFIDSVEPKMKVGLKKQFTSYNSDEQLPSDFKTNGFNMPIKKIDDTSKFKVSPDSTNGDLLYDKSKPNFDSVMHNTIVNDGTETPFSALNLKYTKSNDTVTVKPSNNNLTIGKLFENFVDDAVIIDKKGIMTEVMDAIYGTISQTEEKSLEQIANELKTDKYLEKLINNEDSLDLTDAENNEILNKANEIANGVLYYDMGCGIMQAQLSQSGMTSLIQQISGSSDNFATANAIENTISESTKNNKDIADENKETIKDGFFQKIIKIFTIKMVKAVTTAPQIKMLLAISGAFQNNGIVELGDSSKDFIEKQKIFIKCLIKDIISLISKFIFDLVISFLVKLIAPIIKKIIKERINQYVKILKSLTSRKKTKSLNT